MKRASLLSLETGASPRCGARTRRPFRKSAERGIRRIRRFWFSPPPLPSLAEAERRMRSRPSLITSLTPEQLAFVKAWDGPENSGDPNGPKRVY